MNRKGAQQAVRPSSTPMIFYLPSQRSNSTGRSLINRFRRRSSRVRPYGRGVKARRGRRKNPSIGVPESTSLSFLLLSSWLTLPAFIERIGYGSVVIELTLPCSGEGEVVQEKELWSAWLWFTRPGKDWFFFFFHFLLFLGKEVANELTLSWTVKANLIHRESPFFVPVQ